MSLETELDAVLRIAALKDLVQRYFDDEDRGFAGQLFNTIANNDPGRITVEDVVAVSLLDVPFRAGAVRRLLDRPAEQEAVSSLLDGIPSDLSIWEATTELEHGSPAWKLWDLLNTYPGVGMARVSKLMARKRPRLIPIQDTVLLTVAPSGSSNYWEAFREALRDPSRRDAVEELRQDISSEVSTLRLLDVAIWMIGSDAESAKMVRTDLGLLRGGYDAGSLKAGSH